MLVTCFFFLFFFLHVLSPKDTAERRTPSWGVFWAKLCQKLIGCLLSMMTLSSGNLKVLFSFFLFSSTIRKKLAIRKFYCKSVASHITPNYDCGCLHNIRQCQDLWCACSCQLSFGCKNVFCICLLEPILESSIGTRCMYVNMHLIEENGKKSVIK